MSKFRKAVLVGGLMMLALQGCGDDNDKKDEDDKPDPSDVISSAVHKVSSAISNAIETAKADSIEKAMDDVAGDMGKVVSEIESAASDFIDKNQNHVKSMLNHFASELADMVDFGELNKNVAIETLKEYQGLDFVFKTGNLDGKDQHYCKLKLQGVETDQFCHQVFLKILKAFQAILKEKMDDGLDEQELAEITAFADSIKTAFTGFGFGQYKISEGRKSGPAMLEWAGETKTAKDGTITYPNVNKVWGWLGTSFPTKKVHKIPHVESSTLMNASDYLDSVAQLVLLPGGFEHHKVMEKFMHTMALMLATPSTPIDLTKFDAYGEALPTPVLRKGSSQKKISA